MIPHNRITASSSATPPLSSFTQVEFGVQVQLPAISVGIFDAECAPVGLQAAAALLRGLRHKIETSQLVVLVEIPIDFCQPVILRLSRGITRVKKIRGGRIVRKHVLDCVARRRNRATRWIVQARQFRAEGIDVRSVPTALHASNRLKFGFPPVQPHAGRDFDRIDVGNVDAQTFITDEPEELILEDRSARRGAKLLQRRWSNRLRKIIRGVGRLRVAAECLGRAVQSCSCPT